MHQHLKIMKNNAVIPENQRAFTRTIYPGSISTLHHGSRISASQTKQSLSSASSFRDDCVGETGSFLK